MPGGVPDPLRSPGMARRYRSCASARRYRSRASALRLQPFPEASCRLTLGA
jgi:hypothetical protein